MTARPYVLAERCERRVDAEGYVQVGGVRYSVPPEHVGNSVLVVQSGQRVIVRAGELVIAEHKQLKEAAVGTCVSDEEHVAAMWKHTLDRSQRSQRTTAPPAAPIQFVSTEAVQSPPLSFYEEFSKEVAG